MSSGIVCVEKTVRFPVWQESAAKYCFSCRFMICCICGGNAAIRRCAHKRRRLVLTGTWVPAKDDFFLKISFSPDAQGRKGGCTMTFEQVVLLLTLLGGAIYVTFEITWTVSHSDDKKKK